MIMKYYVYALNSQVKGLNRYANVPFFTTGVALVDVNCIHTHILNAQFII